jgi:hypothetical protein
MLGLAHDYQNLSQWLSEHLRPDRAAQYRLGEESCISGYTNFTNQDLGQYFTNGYNVVYEKTPADVMRLTGSLLLFQHRLLAANQTKGLWVNVPHRLFRGICIMYACISKMCSGVYANDGS